MLITLFSAALLSLGALGQGVDVTAQGPTNAQCKAVNNIMMRIVEIKAGPYCRYVVGITAVTITSVKSVAGGTTVTGTKTTSTKTVTQPGKTSYTNVTVRVTNCASNPLKRLEHRQAEVPLASTSDNVSEVTPTAPPEEAAFGAAAAIPPYPSQLSSYAKTRVRTACSCLKLATPTRTATTTRYKSTVTKALTVVKTQTIRPTTTITKTVTSTACPVPHPTCGVQGTEWAVWPNAQGADLKSDGSNFDPGMYRGIPPARNGTTGGFGGVKIGEDGSVADLFGMGPYQIGADGYVVVNIRGYVYTTVSGEYLIYSNFNAVAYYLWLGGSAWDGYVPGEADWIYPYTEDWSSARAGPQNQERQTPDGSGPAKGSWRWRRLQVPRNLQRRISDTAVSALESTIGSYMMMRVVALQKGSSSGFGFSISPPALEDLADFDWTDNFENGETFPLGKLMIVRQSCGDPSGPAFKPWGQGG